MDRGGVSRPVSGERRRAAAGRLALGRAPEPPGAPAVCRGAGLQHPPAADRPAEFLGEGGGREYQSGRPAAGAPLRVVGRVCVHGPDERGSRSQHEHAHGVQHVDQDDLVGTDEEEQARQHAAMFFIEHLAFGAPFIPQEWEHATLGEPVALQWVVQTMTAMFQRMMPLDRRLVDDRHRS